MEIVQGRTFSREFPTDVQSGLIVNQTAARIMGLETPVGERVRVNERDHTITGVVKDFHIHSLYSEIRPLLIVLRPEECLYILVRIAPDLMSESLALLESKWQRIDPGYNFEYEFLDDRIDRRYRSERRMGRILSTFTALAVLISCLGLLGLAAYMGERRTKEIGIRKVLGSSTSAIVVLLSKEFVRWVLAANLLAWPAAYLLMRNWLRNFAYRAELAWWIFGLAGGAALGIALLTVSFQAVKTAVTDPIDALRYE